MVTEARTTAGIRSASLSRGRWPSLPVLALMGCMALLFVLRYPIAGEHYGFSADSGSYLQTRWWVLGQDNIGVQPMHWRPPLIGIILVPVTALLGDLQGSKLLALLSSVLIAAPVFVILRERGVRPWLALLASVVAAIQPALGGMTTGGYLSMLAAVPLLLGIHWLDQAMYAVLNAESPKAPAFKAAACAFLVAGLNQTMTALFVVAVGIVLAVNLVRAYQAVGWYKPFRGAYWVMFGVAALSGVAMLPWVIGFMIPAMASGYYYADEPWLWVAEAPGAFVALWVGMAFVLWRPLWGVLVLAFAVMALFGSTNIAFNNVLHRAGVWTPLFCTIGLALILEGLRARLPEHWQKKAALAGLALLATVLVFGNVLWMQSARATADGVEMLTADQLAGIDWIKGNTTAEDVVYTHPSGAGWWVGGLANRAWIGSWYVAPVVAADQQQAFYCAMGWRAGCDPYELRDRYGVTVLLFDTSSWQTIRTAPQPGEWNLDQPWFAEQVHYGEVSILRWQ